MNVESISPHAMFRKITPDGPATIARAMVAELLRAALLRFLRKKQLLHAI